MKIVKILNKIALIISSLFIWLAGINMLPDVTAAIATMNEFVATVTALGENKRLEDLRCKK